MSHRAISRLGIAILAVIAPILTALRRNGWLLSPDPAILQSLPEYPESPHVEVQGAGLIFHLGNQSAIGPGSTRDAPSLRPRSQPPYFMYDDSLAYQLVAANYAHSRRSYAAAFANSQ
jgi:hypothetical protein